MKKLIAIALLTLTGVAFAACPAYAPYGCTPGYNGKMICGCGR
jgi:hypothetical protein